HQLKLHVGVGAEVRPSVTEAHRPAHIEERLPCGRLRLGRRRRCRRGERHGQQHGSHCLHPEEHVVWKKRGRGPTRAQLARSGREREGYCTVKLVESARTPSTITSTV